MALRRRHSPRITLAERKELGLERRVEILEQEADERHRRLRQLVRGYLVLALAIGVAIWQIVTVERRQGHDEHATCKIQNTGLRAQRHFVPIMEDINTFLQPQPGQKATPEPFEKALTNIRIELPAWLALEHEQPKSRRC